MANDNVNVVTQIPDIGLVGTEIKRKFRAAVKEAHLEAVRKAKETLKASIILKGSVATKNLLKSVSDKFVKDSSVDGFTSQIYFKRPGSGYAYYANYGRSAGGFPPRKVMLKWARAKGIEENAVYPISRKIADEGTKSRYFMEDAEAKIDKIRENVVSKAVSQFVRSIK
jgi:hypothetical protein